MSDSENPGLDSPDRRDFLLLGLSATALVALSSAPCLALTSVNSPDTNSANYGSAARRAMAGFMDRSRHCAFLSAWIHPDFSAVSSAVWSFAF